MGERRVTLILLLIFCIVLSVSSLGIAFSSSENWVEVARFTGCDNFTTDYFTCDHVEWRIRWEFDLMLCSFPIFPALSVTTFPQGEVSDYVDKINERVGGSKNGTHYIRNNAGTFYMVIYPGSIYSYTIIVEQNTNSVPEFPSWIILPLFLMATFSAIIIKRRLS